MKNIFIAIFCVIVLAGLAINQAKAVPATEAGNLLVIPGLAILGVVLINSKYRHVLRMSKAMGRA